jgi:DNA-binding CsgD family transcriptional regulator
MAEKDLIVPKDHISITSVNDVNAICAPLFQNTDIDSFGYNRIFSDNSRIILNSNRAFQIYELSEIADKLFTYNISETLMNENQGIPYKNISQSCWLVEDVCTHEIFFNLSNKFKLTSGIQLIEKSADYYEVFWFDSQKGKNIVNFYLNNFDVLEKFILYFKEIATNLIKTNEENKILPPNFDPNYKSFLQQTAQNLSLDRSNLQNLNNILQLRKYPLDYDGKKTYITARELDCLQHLAQGNSQKEVGHTLHISCRTVENHLENIKRKLGVYTKKQMLDVYRSNRVSRIHF